MRRLSALVALLAAVATPLRAQAPSPLVPGARVRLTVAADTAAGAADARTRRLTGTIVTVSASDVMLGTGGIECERVPLASIRRLQVSRGSRSLSERALLGSMVGAAAGVVIGLAADCPEGTARCTNRGSVVVVSAALTGGVGAALGLAFAGGERWRDAPMRTVPRIAVAARPGGRLAAVLRF